MNKQIFTLFVILYSFIQAFAQQFPITVIPQFNPPAPVNFHNYADGSTINSPLRIQLLLSDITVINRQIRLKLSFEGNGINFESRNVVVGASQLSISGGEPLSLSNTGLAPYFEFQNIQGINPNVYAQTIPEGSYQFCFEVFDVITGNRLAAKTCITTYIFKNEPPLLNLPYHRSNIEPQPIDNIVFQWTPRHINVSNVEYELSIVEIWDDTVDPQTAFLSLPPIFETTTRATSFLYGPTQPLLLPNKRYAWRIRAKALQGAEEIGLFRNEGKSEIFWFSRTEPCEVPINVYAEPKGISKINVFWDEDPSIYSEYTIAYREAEKPNAHWFTMRTNSGWATVWDLKPGTTYEYKVKGKCKFQYGSYSEVQEVTTDTTQDESANYNCGIVPDAIAINNREPHPGLSISDRITAGDFVVTIVEIDNQSNGRITGRGYVGIPYFNYARFGVKFNNILVNTDKQLAEGEMVTLYDPEFGEGETMTVDLDIDPIGDIYGDDGEVDNTVEVDFVVVEVTTDENGAIIVVGDEGEEEIFAGGQDVVIVDNNGVTWTVGDDDTVTVQEEAVGGPATDDNTEGINEGEVSELTATGVRIDFIDSGYHSYDMLPASITDTKFVENYDTLSASGEQHYIVPYKAVSDTGAKKEDIITAKATFYDTTISTNDIVFKTKEGIKINAIWDKDVATLSLKRKSSFLIEEILATVKPKEEGGKFTIAGAFKLNHLGNKEVANIDVVIVAVNDAKVNTDLNSKINDIYNKAGVNFNVTSGSPLQIPENIWDVDIENGKIDVGDSGLLHYSPEERAIKNYYINSISDYNDKAYYIFVTDIPTSKEGTVGFMPLKGQFGFAFNPVDQARTIAHELGHGVFGLEHPFTEYGIPEKSTDLLMDYNGGTALNHMDWGKMHAPGLQLYWFQGDEEGESANTIKIKNEKVKTILEHFRKRYEGVEDELIWKPFISKMNGRNGRVAIRLDGKYSFNFKGDILSFELKQQPGFSSEKISVIKGSETLEINERSVLGGVYYELTLKTDKGDFIFKFDHHDEIEAFCNYFKIDREESHKLPYVSNYSEQIIDYLNSKFFPKEGITQNTDCNKIDTYFAEIPSSYLSYIHDASFINNERLWSALNILLNCSVNDKGVSEEDAVITIVEALGKRDTNSFLTKLKAEKFGSQNAFRKIYSRIDNWGGKDNFTRLIDVLYTIWKKSDFASKPIHDIPYESDKILGFYFSKYGVKFKGDTSIRLTEEVYEFISQESLPTIQGSAGSSINVITTIKDIGVYDIYDPVKLIKYENIVDPGFKIESVNIPIFILKAIAENYNTNNTDRGANFAFEAALTFSGVGNIARLRHITKFGKLKGALIGLEGADAILSTTNLLLKYSGACDKPEDLKASTQEAKEGKGFCENLNLFADVVGLTSGFTSLAERSTEIKRRADNLLKDIENNPDLISDAKDKDWIISGLKSIIGDTDLLDVDLKDLSIWLDNGSLRKMLLDFENVKLTLSIVEFLLKYSEGCEADETCKQTKFYLDIIQKGIKARDLGVKLKSQAKIFLRKVEDDHEAFNNSAKRKEVIDELKIITGERIPSLEAIFADAKYIKIKQMFDNATPSKRNDLEEAWLVLEPFKNIRVAKDGRNLEVLAAVHSRFKYEGNTSFGALKSLLTEGSSASKQKLLDGLEEVNKIFDVDLPVTFSGIKKGDVTIQFEPKAIDGMGDEIARYVDGVLQKKKIIDEADAPAYEVVGRYDGDDILRNGDAVGFRLANASRNFFKPGDDIAGKTVVQVKAGTNGKIAIIGRKMDGHVNEAVTTLQSQGKQVEAFNDTFQSEKTFKIDGKNYSWQEIIDDFGNMNGQYATNSKGWIIDDDLPKTLMYKANQKWVQKLLDDGYEIIDIGYPENINTLSLFYDMELKTIFP